MNTKHILALSLALALVFGGLATGAAAFDHGKKDGQQMNFEEKFEKKLKIIFSNEDELGLTEAQMAKIKDLKIKTKKDLVKVNAEIDLVALDMKAEMWKDSADINVINKLIDKKYDLKKQKAKSLVAACMGIKDILTKEQQAAMKKLYKKCDKKRSEKECRMKGFKN